MMATWCPTAEKILTKAEIKAVLDDLRRKSRRSPNTRMNLTLFRLATCCGLRASELTRLTLDNVRVGTDSPKIRVPKTIAKGKKARTVPVIDSGTLDDLRTWKALREAHGATGSDLFLVSRKGTAIDRFNARRRFKACCRVLGSERVGEITIHFGRHSFISHALHAGRSVAEVQRAAGHSSLGVTTQYAHLVAESQIADIFG